MSEITKATQGAMDLVRSAVEGGADVDQLERLIALAKDVRREEARVAYCTALAAAKAEIDPTVYKAKKVDYTGKGGRVAYAHAELGDVVSHITPALSRHGLHLSWRTVPCDRSIEVTCTLAHSGGHSESTALRGAPDQSGSKNEIQQIGSTVTYLQRYTAKALLGIAEHGQDDDGRGSSPSTSEPTEAQIDRLRSLAGDDRLESSVRGKIDELLARGCTRERAAKAIFRAKILIEESTGMKYEPPQPDPGQEG